MTANELRRKYLDFFVKNYDHAEIMGSSLIPENDPTVLFTTAGMHPLVPFLMGESHPSGTRLVNVQKCIRTDDIDEVGDDTHLTFFEMLGNWSLGDYFKELAIEMSFKFLTSSLESGGLGFGPDRLVVSCFGGDNDAPRDDEAADIWEKFGFRRKSEGEELEAGQIYFFGKEENWWGPAGQTGPCGPDTEMFYITDKPKCADCDRLGPSCSCGKCVEIWNDVFMQYNKKEDGSYDPLEQQNVDTGMGLERVLAIMNDCNSPFETELFSEIIEEIRLLGGYSDIDEKKLECERVIADHLRAATFILGDECGVSPSNTDQGYVLRRLIRRAISHGRKLGIETDFVRKIAGIVVKNYGDFYLVLERNKEKIFKEIAREENQFVQTLNKGMAVLNKTIEKNYKNKSQGVKALGDKFCFEMFATYGFPIEMTIEELKNRGWINNEKECTEILNEFEKDFEEHQRLSRAGAEKKFSGGLADHSEKIVKLHTATHLLHQALKNVLGDHVEQRGSNITEQRLRFDFSHPEKMTDEQKAQVEEIVNDQISRALPVSCEEMSVDDAKSKGAIGLFESKYGDRVKVYTIGSKEDGYVFSMEICGGPHVENLSELGKFRIKKEQSSSSGVRRIKAVLE
ncbi:alanine--tRNA ligase [Candidatus Peregrinibacteria bacterium]|nr:alanine--tRNA ligase [Candidatus Peregrinibacteria bacterium]